MKKVAVGIAIVVGLLLGGIWIAYANLSPFENKQEYMELVLAEKKWGAVKFDERVFKNATPEVRASMSVDLIKKGLYLGKSLQDVKRSLGENTGYFWSDQIPAYLIEEGWDQNKDTWQLVFLPDFRGLIKAVKIHKNCCSAAVKKTE